MNKDTNQNHSSFIEFMMSERALSFPYIIWLLIIIDIFTRFFLIGRESIWLDEAASINIAQVSSLQNFVNTFAFTTNWWDPHPFFYYSILHYYINLLGTNEALLNSEIVFRSLSAIFGILILPFTYYVGNKLINKDVGILASILLLVNTCNLYYSQSGRMYSLASLLVLISSYFLYTLLSGDSPSRFKHYGIYIFISTILVYTHYIGFIVLAVHFLYGLNFCWSTKNFDKIKGLVLCYAAIFLAYLPWVRAIYNPYSGSSINWVPHPTLNLVIDSLGIVIGILPPDTLSSVQIYNYSDVALFVILIPFLAIGFIISAREKTKFSSLLAAICLIPVALLIISLLSVHIFYSRQISFIVPEICLILAIGFTRFSSLLPKFNPQILNRVAVAVILIGIIFMSSNMYWNYVTDVNENWRGASEYIKGNEGTESCVIIDADYMEMPFKFYFRDERVKSYLIGESDESNAASLVATLSSVDPASYKTIFVILSHNYRYEEKDFTQWLNDAKVNYELSREDLQRIKILKFDIINS